MFSCEERWDIYLTFTGRRRHVRTFRLYSISNELPSDSQSLYFRLPRNAGHVEYTSDGISYNRVTEAGLDRSIEFRFQKSEGWVCASFDIQEECTGASTEIAFRYRPPEGGLGTCQADHSLEVVFHLPMGFPPPYTDWVKRFGFVGSQGGSQATKYGGGLALRLKEYYWPPWGYHIEYSPTTLQGNLHSLFLTERRLVYDKDSTKFLRRGQSALHFNIRPCMEAPLVAIIGGIVLVALLHVPVVWIVAGAVLGFPLFRRGIAFKLVHLVIK